MPKEMMTALPKFGRAPNAPKPPADGAGQWGVLLSGQDRATLLRRDPRLGGQGRRAASSRSAPDEVVERSQPRSAGMSEGAAHFELANHLWRADQRDAAIAHFVECHRLQPDNWTYKRQAWSLVGNERVGGDYGRWAQAPVEGEEADWPFESDFRSDVETVEVGGYYPKTL